MFYKILSKNKKTESLTFKESPKTKLQTSKELPKTKVDLFSTIDQSKIPKSTIETDCHYYVVNEIVHSIDGLTTIKEQEHIFSNGDMYKNKIDARLFYDNQLDEILKLNKLEISKSKLELYLIRNSNLVKEQKILLIDSNGLENIENKKLESFLLSSMGTNIKTGVNSYKDSISTKNSFLDSIYKD